MIDFESILSFVVTFSVGLYLTALWGRKGELQLLLCVKELEILIILTCQCMGFFELEMELGLFTFHSAVVTMFLQSVDLSCCLSHF